MRTLRKERKFRRRLSELEQANCKKSFKVRIIELRRKLLTIVQEQLRFSKHIKLIT